VLRWRKRQQVERLCNEDEIHTKAPHWMWVSLYLTKKILTLFQFSRRLVFLDMGLHTGKQIEKKTSTSKVNIIPK